jgi:hypothetical protein
MATYRIISSQGVDMGTYEGESAEAAMGAMHRAAGYRTSADAASALSTTVEALLAELKITECAPPVRCECGEWSGERCECVVGSDGVTVEVMPEHLRASHQAAGNRGVYPANGAVRLRVSPDCADLMVEADGEWCSIVEHG